MQPGCTDSVNFIDSRTMFEKNTRDIGGTYLLLAVINVFTYKDQGWHLHKQFQIRNGRKLLEIGCQKIEFRLAPQMQ